MVTKLNLVFTNGLSYNANESIKPFYCIESAQEVLKILKDKIVVCKYNSVSTHLTQSVIIEEDGKSEVYTGGIALMSLSPSKIMNKNKDHTYSIQDFLPLLPECIDTIPRKENILESMIATYMIDVKVIDNGSVMHDKRSQDITKYPLSIISRGMQNPINYLDTREIRTNKLKEKNLKDIIEYGKVIIGKFFDENTVKVIANKAMNKVPISFNPQDGPKSYFLAEYFC